MDEKKSDKQRLKEITDSIETGIRELFQSDRYMKYLSVMSRFHRYSVNNQMLIYMQCPSATHVAGFNKWKSEFSRSVKKGERGIRIIAPAPYSKKIETDKLDPDTKLPILDADGKPVREEKTIKVPFFKVTSVFDVAQTEGKPLPELAKNLTGDVENYDVFMEAVRRSSPVPIEFAPLEENTDGFFSAKTQSISIREGMSEVQTVCAAIHEISHSKLHNKDAPEAKPQWKLVMVSEGGTKHDYLTAFESEAEAIKTGEENGWRYVDENGFDWQLEVEEDNYAQKAAEKNRNTQEVEAESISYAVCKYYGIETGENSFGYIASWSADKELSELKASLETINKTASELISDIDRNYAQITKERGLDKVQEEPEQAELVPDKTVSIRKMNEYGYSDEDMLPLSQKKALELYNQDVPLYMLQPSGKAEIVFDRTDITDHKGLFGIEKSEWEQIKHRIVPEAIFNDINENGFMIYQLRDEPDNAKHLFLAYDQLAKLGLTLEKSRYEPTYADTLAPFTDRAAVLEEIYTRFNVKRPETFHGHSLSVSDIVVLKQDGVVSSHYVDSFGFREIPEFTKPENYLKNAELQVEDDADMIDGVISNGRKQEETRQKKSVLQQLYQKRPKEPIKTDRKKSHKEMER